MQINKDTKLFISIAGKAGNFGCAIHNAAFKFYKLNCIYKSFSVSNLEAAIQAIKVLDISGSAITMPYKIEVLRYLDVLTYEVEKIGSCNTIVNENGKLIGYNTDQFSAHTVIDPYCNYHKNIYILGNGGYAKSVMFAAQKLGLEMKILTRKNWDEIKSIGSGIVFNCTPVSNLEVYFENNNEITFIDSLITTETGRHLSLLQASRQFELYTNKKFPMDHIKENLNTLLNL